MGQHRESASVGSASQRGKMYRTVLLRPPLLIVFKPSFSRSELYWTPIHSARSSLLRYSSGTAENNLKRVVGVVKKENF